MFPEEEEEEIESMCEICGLSYDEGSQACRICHACLSAIAGTPASAVPNLLWAVWSDEVSEARLTPVPTVPAPRRVACHAALPALLARAAEQPEDVRIALKVAETAALAGEVEMARSAFESAYELYFRSNFPLKALAVARALISMEPDSVDAQLRAARVQVVLNYNAQARREAFAVVRLSWPEVPSEAIEIIAGYLTHEEQRTRLRAKLVGT